MKHTGIGTVKKSALPNYMHPMKGTYKKKSVNYGNYIDAHGSIYVCIPKTYSKKKKNGKWDFSFKPKKGYELERAFIDEDEEKDAVFIMKYQGGNENGIFSSKREILPVSTSSTQTPVSEVNGCTQNRYDEMYTACKSIGYDFFLTSVFIWDMLSRMRQTFNNEGRTHNGNSNGIFDIAASNGRWEVASGLVCDGTSYKLLKKSISVKNITEDSAYDFTNYEEAELSALHGFVVEGEEYVDENLACLVGGSWYYGSLAGAFALALDAYRSDSHYYVGGRASVFL